MKMMTNHLEIGTTCVHQGSLWKIDTRVGGVYRIERGSESKLVNRKQIKRYAPRAGTAIA